MCSAALSAAAACGGVTAPPSERSLSGPDAPDRPRRSWSAPRRGRRRRRPRGSPRAPPASRSQIASTPHSSKPSSRTASSARIVEPPVVTTSSTSMQRSPRSSSGPSIRRARPCALASLRTKNALTSAPPASAEQAIGSAPIVIPPTAVAPHSRGLGGDQLTERAEAVGQQDRALGVDQVLRDRPAGECHLADDERVLAQLGEEPLPRVHRPVARSDALVGRAVDVDPVADARASRMPRSRRRSAAACSRGWPDSSGRGRSRGSRSRG